MPQTVLARSSSAASARSVMLAVREKIPSPVAGSVSDRL